MLLLLARGEWICRRTRRNNDDDEQDDDANNQAHAHLHILPPHLFPDTVGASAKSLSGDGEVIGFVLKRVQTSATFRDFVDVVAHDANGTIDFLSRWGQVAIKVREQRSRVHNRRRQCDVQDRMLMEVDGK